MQILLANPRGFCAGVDRAIEIVERALELFGAPIYVRHEVVHNRHVVEGLRERGTVFVNELDEVPDGATVIYSAHGVARAVHEEGERRGLRVFDATCPLVTKVHLEVRRHAEDGRECILIGHKGHPEVEGTMGQYGSSRGGVMHLVETPEDVQSLQVNNPDELAFVTQTTLSVDDTEQVIDALRQRFPNIKGPRQDDICYATQNRQDAVKTLAQKSDVILVVGSPNSSNSNRLRELAEKQGVPAYLVDEAGQIEKQWLDGCESIGVTAGASAPEDVVTGVIEKLCEWGGTPGEEAQGRKEPVTFSLPRALQGREFPGAR
jgi:4-hydroxy-3-methylbut-2-enyl diphosphate reductase